MAQSETAQELQRTPFHDLHVALGAKMVPFAGFEMPVHYPAGITAEHRAVRERCGIFDVSHMGEFIIRGHHMVDFVNHVTTNDVAALDIGQAHYSTICNERGTIEDDCLVYRLEDRMMIVVNASNREKDLAHIQRFIGPYDVTVEDVSDATALLAVQGPLAESILQSLTVTDLSAIGYYRFAEAEVAGVPAVVSRTGYTGEDGFELYFDGAHGVRMWEMIAGAGEVMPCGLGCRDSLRLEAGLALYGNDIDDTTTPFEGGLGWLVKLKKGPFVGSEALAAQKERGVPRKLVGFTIDERAFPRHGYPVFWRDQPSGVVCSGTMSPTLGIPIGTCYLPMEGAKEGEQFEVEIRGKRVPARVMKLPFYKRQ